MKNFLIGLGVIIFSPLLALVVLFMAFQLIGEMFYEDFIKNNLD